MTLRNRIDIVWRWLAEWNFRRQSGHPLRDEARYFARLARKPVLPGWPAAAMPERKYPLHLDAAWFFHDWIGHRLAEVSADQPAATLEIDETKGDWPTFRVRRGDKTTRPKPLPCLVDVQMFNTVIGRKGERTWRDFLTRELRPVSTLVLGARDIYEGNAQLPAASPDGLFHVFDVPTVGGYREPQYADWPKQNPNVRLLGGWFLPAERARLFRGTRVFHIPAGLPKISRWQAHSLAYEAAFCGCDVTAADPADLPETLTALGLSPLTDANRADRHRQLARALQRDISAEAFLRTASGLGEPLVKIVCPTMRPSLLPTILDNFERQNWPNKVLVIGFNCQRTDLPADVVAELAQKKIAFTCSPRHHTIGAVLKTAVTFGPDADFWMKMDDDDLYGPHYVSDMLLAAELGDFDLVGVTRNPIHFVDTGQTNLRARTDTGGTLRRPDLAVGAQLTGPSHFTRLGPDKRSWHLFDPRVVGCADLEFQRRLDPARRLAGFTDQLVQCRISHGAGHTWSIALSKDNFRQIELPEWAREPAAKLALLMGGSH